MHINSYKAITNTARIRARLCKLQKGCTRLAAASAIKLTSCLPMDGGPLRLLPPLKLVAMILLKVALSTKNHQSIIRSFHVYNNSSIKWIILYLTCYMFILLFNMFILLSNMFLLFFNMFILLFQCITIFNHMSKKKKTSILDSLDSVSFIYALKSKYYINRHNAKIFYTYI